MAQIPLRNLDGGDLGSVEVSDSVFAVTPSESLVHQAVVRQQANSRLGSHQTKTRGEVAGGGAKPWRQKGTGRARQGSRVSPLWRGGGITFGPVQRGYQQAMPKKMRQGAMRSALSARLADGAVLALESFGFSEPGTKQVTAALSALDIHGQVVIVDDRFDANAHLSSRNIPGVTLQDSVSLNVLDVLGPDKLVFTKAALATVEKRLTAEGK